MVASGRPLTGFTYVIFPRGCAASVRVLSLFSFGL